MRRAPALKAAVTLLGAAAGLVAAVTAVALFWAAETSASRDTLATWSCRWRDVYMTARPHFGTLCRQSRAAAYLGALLVPVEVATLGVAAWQAVLERNAAPRVFAVSGREKRAGSSAAGSVPGSRGETVVEVN